MSNVSHFISINIHPNAGGLRQCYRATDVISISESSLGNGILHIGNPQTGKVEHVVGTAETYDELVELLSMANAAIHGFATTDTPGHDSRLVSSPQ